MTTHLRRNGRAAPLAPDERRRAIVDAVVPLLVEHHGEVSTRQIAEAAGIAEGTIFRVFPDKGALFLAAAQAVINPEDLEEQHAAAVAGRALLREEVRATAEWMGANAERSMGVLMALRQHWMSRPHDEGHKVDPRAVFQRSAEDLQRVLTAMFARHAEELTVDPAVAATLLRTLVLGSRHPGADAARRLGPAQITDALLDGVLDHSHDHHTHQKGE